jgi:starch synthase
VRILFATSECAPWIKTGGLADVAGALPAALVRLGAEVLVLLPLYPAVRTALQAADMDAREVARIEPLGGMPAATVLLARAPGGVDLLLLQAPLLFDRPGNPYVGPDGKDWPDNDLRFALLSRAAVLLAAGAAPGGAVDVLHCNDWQTGLAPVYLRHGFAAAAGVAATTAAPMTAPMTAPITAPITAPMTAPKTAITTVAGPRVASVLTVHNLAYQGSFVASRLAALGLPPAAFTIEGVEFYGRISFLKGALACSDAITTVSPTYAREICGDELGFGLQGLLAQRTDVLTGILNGIDTQEWDPASDPHLPYRFDIHRLANKALCKRALQAEVGLPVREDVPLFGVVSRLVAQKGVDLIAEIAPQLAALPAQLIVLGTGDKLIEERLQALARDYPESIHVRIAFDEGVAHRIEAGIDLFLMPSRFEPCGLNQMYSQRYGTPPIVCATGGLADSVIDCNSTTLAARTASGFVFHPPVAAALLGTVRRAVALYRDKAYWPILQRNAMDKDFTWDASARLYLEVYEAAIANG